VDGSALKAYDRRLRLIAAAVVGCGLAATLLTLLDIDNQNPASALLFAGGLFDVFLGVCMVVYVALIGRDRRSIASPEWARTFFSLFVLAALAFAVSSLFLGELVDSLYLALALLVIVLALTLYWLRVIGDRWKAGTR
jgi:hypothetical protein